jgi:RNA polymerase sigma factor (sigma-70 family)
MVKAARSRVRDAAAAEEIVHDAFARFLQVDSYREKSTEELKLMLFKSVSNASIDFVKYANLRETPDSPNFEDVAAVEDPALDAIHNETVREMIRFMDNLEDPLKLVLRLRYDEGMSHAQIAKRAGSTRRGAEYALYKALGLLREQMKDWSE